MPVVITLPCVGVKDGSCLAVCPVDAIHPKPGTPEFAIAKQLFIDPDTCTCCHLCIDECPVQAIYPDDDLPVEWQSSIEANAAFFRPPPTA